LGRAIIRFAVEDLPHRQGRRSEPSHQRPEL
jgi:hypothetical protein